MAQKHNQTTKITRREFFGKVGKGAVAVAGSSVMLGTVTAHALDKKKRYALFIDLTKCFGCHACSVACKSEFDVPLGVWRNWLIVKEHGKYPKVSRTFVPVNCNHCDNPECVKVCPTKATVKSDNGIVTQDDKKCIGCKYCIQACPYQSKYAHPKKKVAHKCEFCQHRLAQGILPSCVNTCNAKARTFGDINDPHSEISKLLKKHKGQIKTLQPEKGTKPHVYYLGLQEGAYSLNKS